MSRDSGSAGPPDAIERLQILGAVLHQYRHPVAGPNSRGGQRPAALEQARLAAKAAPQDAQIAELVRRLESPAAENE